MSNEPLQRAWQRSWGFAGVRLAESQASAVVVQGRATLLNADPSVGGERKVLEQLANLGELIGGLGTLAALVYLAARVRHSNRLARATSRQQLLDTFYDRAWASGTDQRLARVFAGGVMNSERLSNADKTTFQNMMVRWLGNIENGLALRRDGLVEDEPVQFIPRAMANCINAPGGRAWWEATKREELVSHEVASYLDSILADPRLETVGFDQVFPFWAALADEPPSNGQAVAADLPALGPDGAW